MNKETVKIEIVAGVVLKREGKYLLVQEKQPRAYGLWNLPAGKVDVGETIEEAAVREAKEETGFDVRLISKIGVIHEAVNKPVKHAFSVEVIGGELSFSKDEMLDAKWFTLEEIKEMEGDLREGWPLEVISALLS